MNSNPPWVKTTNPPSYAQRSCGNAAYPYSTMGGSNSMDQNMGGSNNMRGENDIRKNMGGSNMRQNIGGSDNMRGSNIRQNIGGTVYMGGSNMRPNMGGSNYMGQNSGGLNMRQNIGETDHLGGSNMRPITGGRQSNMAYQNNSSGGQTQPYGHRNMGSVGQMVARGQPMPQEEVAKADAGQYHAGRFNQSAHMSGTGNQFTPGPQGERTTSYTQGKPNQTQMMQYNYNGGDNQYQTQAYQGRNSSVLNQDRGAVSSTQAPDRAQDGKVGKSKMSQLRILTGRVLRVKEWMAYQLPFPVLYNIYGSLLAPINNTTTLEGSVTKKTFLLCDPRDKEHKLRCVYYEIEQKLKFIDTATLIMVTGSRQYDGSVQVFKVTLADTQQESLLPRLENFATRGIKLALNK